MLLIRPTPASSSTATASARSEPPASWQWARSADGQRIDTHGQATTDELDTLDTSGGCILVVPIDWLAWHRVQLPPGRAARQIAVIAGLIEDAVLDDPAMLHMALEPPALRGAGPSSALVGGGVPPRRVARRAAAPAGAWLASACPGARAGAGPGLGGLGAWRRGRTARHAGRACGGADGGTRRRRRPAATGGRTAPCLGRGSDTERRATTPARVELGPGPRCPGVAAHGRAGAGTWRNSTCAAVWARRLGSA
jgi:hypothetical protein